MRYVMFIHNDPAKFVWWDGLTRQERQADIDRHEPGSGIRTRWGTSRAARSSAPAAAGSSAGAMASHSLRA